MNIWVDEWADIHAAQRAYNYALNQFLDTILHNLETRPMTRLTDYTTEELTRLTTLSERTAKPGEFCTRPTCATRMRIARESVYGAPQVVAKDGTLFNALSGTVERRVTSFTDPTELDPPQAEMLAELERRRRPVVSNEQHGGRRIVSRLSGLEGRLLDASSARRFQKGWEADGFASSHVWALLDNGHVTGNPGSEWKLLD